MKRIVKTVRFPEEILEEVRLVRNRAKLTFTDFIIEAIKSYIHTLNYIEGINKSFGAWKISKQNEIDKGNPNSIINKTAEDSS